MFHSSFRFLIPAFFAVSSLSAVESFPWGRDAIPETVKNAALLPDWVFCETPCDWREQVGAIFRPVVKDCSSAREAVLKIAAGMSELTGVYYTMERRKPAMNALESLSEKKVSCTGQSILLVCALRSVGIPARVVWVMTWNHVPGNHTWVEAWVDGTWQMIEFNEKDFNTPWVMESIGMLDPNLPEQRVYAVGGGQADKSLPLSASVDSSLLMEDVTERYMLLARRWYMEKGFREDCQRVMVDILPRSDKVETVEILDEQGKIVSRAVLPGHRDDVRKFASLTLPRSGKYTLCSPLGKQVLVATAQPVRIIRLVRDE